MKQSGHGLGSAAGALLACLALACSSGSPGNADAGGQGTPDSAGGTAAPDSAADDIAAAPACTIATSEPPDFTQRLGCRTDFDALASEPLDSSIPGARSVKVVIDGFFSDAVYFQNSRKYKIHYEFVSKHLSGGGKPIVPSLMKFNETEYYSAARRFILGAVTYYEGPKVWAFEVAPYDTADEAMIARAFTAISKAAFFGGELVFHPTSNNVERVVPMLPATVKVKTTADLFAGIDYQPLNLATGVGRLRFLAAKDLETEYVAFRDILVLDAVPNDISVVAGIITQEFQTPLSHINVLSQNRRTPNMSLRDAHANERLRALEGKWVRLSVGPFEWSISEVTAAEADAFWESRRPAPIRLPAVDTTARDLKRVEELVPLPATNLREAIKAAIPAWGGKAAHFSVLARIEGVPTPRAFAVPAFYYVQFMEQNGLYARLDALLADPEFKDKPEVRDRQLKAFRDAMKAAPVDEGLQQLLRAKLAADYPGRTMRFRTSTNSEDLEGFPCAGCYESHTGDPAVWDTVVSAIRKTWASVWLFRTFEERTYNGVDHKEVVMALLVHPNFPAEEANGVALTANPFDPSGLVPGQYVNVQHGGEVEVVHPPPGVTSEEFIFQFAVQGQPIIYRSRSSLVPDDQTVLTRAQVFKLGTALDAIHRYFSAAYGPAAGNRGWYAMDVEFKFDGEPGEEPALFVKQARPHPGRGMVQAP